MYVKLFPLWLWAVPWFIALSLCLASPLVYYLDRFYTIIEVGVHILIGVSHILCKWMIDMLPEIVELIHQCGKSPFLCASMQYVLKKLKYPFLNDTSINILIWYKVLTNLLIFIFFLIALGSSCNFTYWPATYCRKFEGKKTQKNQIGERPCFTVETDVLSSWEVEQLLLFPNAFCIALFLTLFACISFSAGEFSESGSSWTLAGTWLLQMDVEPGLLKPLLDGRLKLVLGLNINVFSCLFTSRVCIFLFSCKEMFMKPTSSWLVIGEIRRSCLDKRWCWNPNP